MKITVKNINNLSKKYINSDKMLVFHNIPGIPMDDVRRFENYQFFDNFINLLYNYNETQGKHKGVNNSILPKSVMAKREETKLKLSNLLYGFDALPHHMSKADKIIMTRMLERFIVQSRSTMVVIHNFLKFTSLKMLSRKLFKHCNFDDEVLIQVIVYSKEYKKFSIETLSFGKAATKSLIKILEDYEIGEGIVKESSMEKLKVLSKKSMTIAELGSQNIKVNINDSGIVLAVRNLTGKQNTDWFEIWLPKNQAIVNSLLKFLKKIEHGYGD